MSQIDKLSQRREAILTQPIFPLLVKMSLPTIVGMCVTIIFNLTDTFFIGLLHNKSMTASIGVIFSYVSLCQALGFWFGYGSGNNMSKRLGENNKEEASIISSIAINFSLVTGVIIAALTLIFLKASAILLGGNASADLLAYSMDYLKVIAFSVPCTIYAIVIYNQLRLCGNTKDAVFGLLAGMFTNMILDPVFIFTFDMGFIGAGYATLIGQFVGCVTLTYFSFRNGNIPVSLTKFKINKERLYHILVGGLPNFARQGINAFSLVILNLVCAQYGEELIAAMTVSQRIVLIAYLAMIGWNQGFQPICAMNYGAKLYRRVKEAFLKTVIVGAIWLFFASVIIYIVAPYLAALLISDQEVIEKATFILRMQGFTLPLLGFQALSGMLMQNVGKYYSSLVITISRQGLVFIPVLFTLSFAFGAIGVYIAQPVSDLISIAIALYFTTKFLASPAFLQQEQREREAELATLQAKPE